MNTNNIFLCIPTFRSGGAERFVTELACSVNKDRFNIIVVVTGVFERSSFFYMQLCKAGIQVIDATAENYLKQIYVLLKLIRKYKPAIVHSNVSSSLHVLLPTFLLIGRKKHLFTTHSMGYRLFSGLKKKLMKMCFRTGIVIPVAICDTVKKSIENEYHLPASKIECVFNGVDTVHFCGNKMQNDNRPFTFVCVGTLYYIKNHDLLIDAFRIVNNKYRHTRLVLVGDGNLRDSLVKKVEQYGLLGNVLFAGNQSDVKKYLTDSDVYCCASKVEGFPISVLEAMACSLPVITTPAGGVVDIVKDGVNGFIVDADAGKYANKMIDLIQDRHLRGLMSEASRMVAREYSIEKCSKGYENLYKKYGC